VRVRRLPQTALPARASGIPLKTQFRLLKGAAAPLEPDSRKFDTFHQKQSVHCEEDWKSPAALDRVQARGERQVLNLSAVSRNGAVQESAFIGFHHFLHLAKARSSRPRRLMADG
jgi:hypothetical protein